MPQVGYYRPQQTLEAQQRGESAPPTAPASGMGWMGTIGGERIYLGGLRSDATQKEAEEFYRNSSAYNTSAGMGFLGTDAWNQLNPNATAAERAAYNDLHRQRQGAINASHTDDMIGPARAFATALLIAGGGAALSGAMGGAGAGTTAGTAGTSAGTTAGLEGIGSGIASGGLGAAGTAGGTAAGGAAAGAGGAAAGGGLLGASAIPEVVVTGSAGGGAGAGAAGAAGSGASFWDSMHNAASDTSSVNAASEQYLSSLEAPTAQYGIDWMDVARRAGNALSQGQGQQAPMMGGGMPGLLGGGAPVAAGVSQPRTRVLRSPLEQYMALSRIGLLGSKD